MNNVAPFAGPTLNVSLALSTELESEAFAARIAQEPGFAVSPAEGKQPIHVWLASNCGRFPAVLLVDAAAAPRSCTCCRRLSRRCSWPNLFAALRQAAGPLRSTQQGEDAANLALAGSGADEIACLTRRERDVLRLVGQGMSTPMCAEKLGLAVSTVGNHKHRLMRKLKVRTSLELLRIAMRNGLADL